MAGISRVAAPEGPGLGETRLFPMIAETAKADRGQIKDTKQIQYFAKCVEKADWPESGLFPRVSKKTAERLGMNDPEWNSWRKFATLRGLIGRAKKFSKIPILQKKLKNEKKRVINE